ncbi:hypothetical protein Taro_051184, partial [Colocasia esculenta]|nr:hypothetical protein [Colocasia esculenta]
GESGGKILETPARPEGIGEEGGRGALKKEKNPAGPEERNEQAGREGPKRRARRVGCKMEMCHVGHEEETCRVGHKKEMCHVGHGGERTHGKVLRSTKDDWDKNGKDGGGPLVSCLAWRLGFRLGIDILTLRYFLINFAQRADDLALLGEFKWL